MKLQGYKDEFAQKGSNQKQPNGWKKRQATAKALKETPQKE
jgi:hypothetical protein